MSVEKKLVQMRLNVTTIDRINKIMEIINLSNRTQIISQSVAVYYEILSAVKEKGGDIYIEYPDKTRAQLIITHA